MMAKKYEHTWDIAPKTNKNEITVTSIMAEKSLAGWEMVSAIFTTNGDIMFFWKREFKKRIGRP